MGDDESIGFAHAMRSQQNGDYVTLLLEMIFFCFFAKFDFDNFDFYFAPTEAF